ncbi:MAG TPA: hypothetical protein PKN50_03165 [Spirochaetota bacterium]|nr:hypothetical protein [Spirochaetota bacterium]HPV43021.1 hypothetical protein [Spirochaetota bacterium]
MGQREEWNHDVIFDYMDRYIAVELAVNGKGAWTRSWSRFAENAWDLYRPGLSAEWPVWTRTNVADDLFCD